MVIGLMPLHSIQECIFRGSEGFAADFLRFANRLALHFICVLDSFGVDDKMIEDGDLVFSLVTTRRLSHGPELRDQIVVDDRNMRIAVAGEVPVGDTYRPTGFDGVGKVVILLGTDGTEGGPFLAGAPPKRRTIGLSPMPTRRYRRSEFLMTVKVCPSISNCSNCSASSNSFTSNRYVFPGRPSWYMDDLPCKAASYCLFVKGSSTVTESLSNNSSIA